MKGRRPCLEQQLMVFSASSPPPLTLGLDLCRIRLAENPAVFLRRPPTAAETGHSPKTRLERGRRVCAHSGESSEHDSFMFMFR